MSSDDLVIWTVYDHPLDWPDWYVARAWIWDKPTGHMIMNRALEPLREQLARRGLTCLTRHPTDDPKIIETWL